MASQAVFEPDPLESHVVLPQAHFALAYKTIGATAGDGLATEDVAKD